jgi:hypothetical protein
MHPRQAEYAALKHLAESPVIIELGLQMGPALQQLALDAGRLVGGPKRVIARNQRAVPVAEGC